MCKVAIILINYKNYAERFLPACMESLRKVAFPAGEFKIFIVDNETSPETREYIIKIAPEAVLVPKEKNEGFAGGNNAGMREAENWGADYFYLLNMDTEVEPDFLEKALTVYQSDPNIGLVQSRLMLFNEKEKVNSIGNRLHFLGIGFCDGYKEDYKERAAALREIKRDAPAELKDIVYPSGAAVMISRERLKDIGYFTDELFMYLEDAEWGWKSRIYGFRNVLAADSVVYHKYEFSRSSKMIFWIERNRLILTLMCYRVPTLLMLFPAWLVMEGGLLIFSLRGGWFSDKIRSYKWFLNFGNLKKLFDWRDVVEMKRVEPDWKVARNFSGKVDFQEVGGGKLVAVGNAILNIYWQIAKRLIVW
jgi:GT2 family glycosyltransferase